MTERRYRSREWEKQHPLVPIDKELCDNIKKNVKSKYETFSDAVQFLYNVYTNLHSQVDDEEFEEFIRQWRKQHSIKKKDIKRINNELYRRLENE